ncbi:Mu-like prophage FluMu DNA-binding protein Ner family protein [Eikenella corrodens ATCC 23834]|uniref:Mu-like prophage FluMu DNA-binding protein Ner family protein n=1 Tax=Eikenella corrodens ATCC 23834 TaxID=546274 RepID=C0DX46_EIKCO|nr:helix-turn-helix domain-containing protein [Eikenella corrodens]EEG23361.1 Mu-like prophage FluMu DNA-binding protein Ner family protein [Eikenella corrodens ATCC 23834]UAK74665.1 helix-turn-helix domain-containing protein [Eikenella corrodens]
MKKNTAQKATPELLDWHRADIIAALKKRGWSIRALAAQANVHPTTLYGALIKPYPKSERVIADALGMKPEQIWPQRYAARNFQPVLRRTCNA